MAGPKTDYLAVCNNHGVPIPDFVETFCKRCVNPECTRSSQGNFVQRVTTWQDRLFLNPPRMDPSDPRYQQISAQKFISLDPTRTVGQSAWVDPRDLEAAPVKPQPAPAPAPPPPPMKGDVADMTVQKSKTLEVSEKVSEPPKQPMVHQKPLQTPYQPGLMVGSAPQPEVRPEKDPWDNPQKTSDGEKIVKPGTKIRMGH